MSGHKTAPWASHLAQTNLKLFINRRNIQTKLHQTNLYNKNKNKNKLNKNKTKTLRGKKQCNIKCTPSMMKSQNSSIFPSHPSIKMTQFVQFEWRLKTLHIHYTNQHRIILYTQLESMTIPLDNTQIIISLI
ncbi:MAG: hypothetical protein [Microvirus sp.]|nr:MAG: hypothetical protein [Microvirus sp.]